MLQQETLVLTGHDLTIGILVRAARQPHMRVVLCDEAITSMTKNRAFAERIAARGDHVYGLTTGVGVRKARYISPSEMAVFNKRMLRDHATGQGPELPEEVVRASTIVLLNSLAAGRTNVRPKVAIHIAERLSKGNI